METLAKFINHLTNLTIVEVGENTITFSYDLRLVNREVAVWEFVSWNFSHTLNKLGSFTFNYGANNIFVIFTPNVQWNSVWDLFALRFDHMTVTQEYGKVKIKGDFEAVHKNDINDWGKNIEPYGYIASWNVVWWPEFLTLYLEVVPHSH